jgi:hypothetical protein
MSTYDRNNGDLLNIYQYKLNLTASKIAKKPQWTLTYNYKDAYGIEDVINGDSMQKVADQMEDDDKMLGEYYTKTTDYAVLFPVFDFSLWNYTIHFS